MWQKIHDELRQRVRKRAQRKGTATAWLIDSLLRGGRSLAGVKTTDDDGKKVHGRKRHNPPPSPSSWEGGWGVGKTLE